MYLIIINQKINYDNYIGYNTFLNVLNKVNIKLFVLAEKGRIWFGQRRSRPYYYLVSYKYLPIYLLSNNNFRVIDYILE